MRCSCCAVGPCSLTFIEIGAGGAPCRHVNAKRRFDMRKEALFGGDRRAWRRRNEKGTDGGPVKVPPRDGGLVVLRGNHGERPLRRIGVCFVNAPAWVSVARGPHFTQSLGGSPCRAVVTPTRTRRTRSDGRGELIRRESSISTRNVLVLCEVHSRRC